MPSEVKTEVKKEGISNPSVFNSVKFNKDDFSDYYETRLAGVYLMHWLTLNNGSIHSGPSKTVEDYLLVLKGLLVLLSLEKERKNYKPID